MICQQGPLIVAALVVALLPPSSYGQALEGKPPRRILGIGGGTYSTYSQTTPLLPKYIVALTGKKDPVIYYLPTAGGDAAASIVQWYEVMHPLECRPRHLRLFSDSYRLKNIEDKLLAADAIFVGGGNTMNMLAIWKAHGVDKVLRKAWERGIVLAGESAGMICWFEQGLTDSRADQLTALECLGFLKGSACPHYSNEPQRKGVYQRMLLAGELKDGVACDNGTALLYEGTELAGVVSVGDKAGKAYRVRREGNKVVEEPLKVSVMLSNK